MLEIVMAEPPVAFITPRVRAYHAPAQVSVQLRVPRHVDNRWVFVSWDAAPCQEMILPCLEHGVCEAGSFLVQVDGAQASTIQPLEPREVEIRARCPYEFEAELQGAGGWVRGRAAVQVLIQ